MKHIITAVNLNSRDSKCDENETLESPDRQNMTKKNDETIPHQTTRELFLPSQVSPLDMELLVDLHLSCLSNVVWP